jgi:hypothetical protein
MFFSLLLLLLGSSSIFMRFIFNRISENSFLYLLPLLLKMIIVIVTIDINCVCKICRFAFNTTHIADVSAPHYFEVVV